MDLWFLSLPQVHISLLRKCSILFFLTVRNVLSKLAVRNVLSKSAAMVLSRMERTEGYAKGLKGTNVRNGAECYVENYITKHNFGMVLNCTD